MNPMLDLVIRHAWLPGAGTPQDIGIAAGRIAAIAPALPADGPELLADGLVIPGLVETHLHLDKTCILDRCAVSEGSVTEAVRLTSAAKRDFTAADVRTRGARTLDRCIGWGTTRIRTQVEVDPGIGLRGFDGVQQLARNCAWAVDMELYVFPRRG